jgi:hypothetical protein
LDADADMLVPLMYTQLYSICADVVAIQNKV